MPPQSAPPQLPADPADRERRYALAGREMQAPRLASGLHVVATPIGNLRDITLRAIETLAAADLIACEDTRITGRLREHYGIATPMLAYHEHNAAAARPRILAALADGAVVALVSDAGTPLISDPGFKLVQAAREAGYAVTSAPGPSAVLAGLAVAGLPTDRFFFEGFLPAKAAARGKRIAQIAGIPATLVLFETGPRLAGALADLAHGLDPDGLGAREAAVCRELTKLHEEVRTGDLAALAAHYAGEAETRGEFVLLVAGAPEAEAPGAADLDALLRAALRQGSVKDAVAEVAAVTGAPRKSVYQRALVLVRDAGDADAPPQP